MFPDSIFQSFLTLFVVVDPIGVAVLFLGLAGSRSKTERRAIARKAVLVAMCVLFAFALFGSAILSHLGITLNAFRVAGGLLLRLLGRTGVNVVTRILGILLAALAVQYIADGAKGLWS